MPGAKGDLGHHPIAAEDSEVLQESQMVTRLLGQLEGPDDLALPTLPLNSDITPTSPVTVGAIVAVTATTASSVISPLTNTLVISPVQSGGQAP